MPKKKEIKYCIKIFKFRILSNTLFPLVDLILSDKLLHEKNTAKTKTKESKLH